MAKKKSKKGKGLYASYKLNGTWLKNKIRKLKRLIKEQPNNLPLVKALAVYQGANAPEYKRKASRSKHWTPGRIEFAKGISKLGINGNMALLEAPVDSKESREQFSNAWSKATAKAVLKPGLHQLTDKHAAHYAAIAK